MLQCRVQFSNPELNFFSNPAAGNGVPTDGGLLEERSGDVPLQRTLLLHVYNGRYHNLVHQLLSPTWIKAVFRFATA